MAKPVDKEEIKRRVDAFEATKKQVKGGSIALAAKALGNVSRSALSTFLLNQNLSTARGPEFSKEECIAALLASIARHKKVPSRDEFNREGEIRVCWKTHWGTWDEFLTAAGLIGDPSNILLLDIETAPMLAMVWGTRKQYINHEWIIENGYIMCWTAKWLGSDEQIFKKFTKGKPLDLLKPIHALLDEARVVVHFNGKKFDVPTLNREFLLHGLTPPSPYKQVDCLLTLWDNFAFPVNKLDYIAKILGIGQKLSNEGPEFWKACMSGDPEAWKRMEEYNRHDVTLLEGVYKRLLPWIKKHPSLSSITGNPVCPACGSYDFDRDRDYIANQLRYEQYKCGGCGAYFKSNKSINPRGEKRFSLTA